MNTNRTLVPAWRAHIALALLFGCFTYSHAQFNIKVGADSIVPSPSFGGAALQPGPWNVVSSRTERLIDVNGRRTEVTISQPDGGGYSGGNPSVSDYNKLLDGFLFINSLGFVEWTIENLPEGTYDIYTYGVMPFTALLSDTYVRVPASQDSTQIISGPLPSDFRYLQTHTVHRVTMNRNGNGKLVVQMYSPRQPESNRKYAVANGFQIVPVGGVYQNVAETRSSFNLDIESGTGLPSDVFGAAANQPGHWSPLYNSSSGLTNIAGHRTNVTVTEVESVQSGGSGGGLATDYTPEYRHLMGDHRQIGTIGQDGRVTMLFENLPAGTYDIYTYGSTISGGFPISAIVTIPEAVTQTQVMSGPLTPNTFVRGVTHTIHRITVGRNGRPGSFRVTIARPNAPQMLTLFNGMQIVRLN